MYREDYKRNGRLKEICCLEDYVKGKGKAIPVCMYKGWARNTALAPRPSMIYCASAIPCNRPWRPIGL
jgi:hypothetical protein